MHRLFPRTVGVIPLLLLILCAASALHAQERVVTSETDLTRANTTLLVQSNVTVTSNIEVPATSTLRFVRGGLLTVNGSLRIRGGIDAGLFRIFAGTGRVTGSPQVEEFYPQWFYDGGADWAPAFQKAVRMIPRTGGTLRVPACDNYELQHTVFIPYDPTAGSGDSSTAKVVDIVGEGRSPARHETPYSSITITGAGTVGFRINSADDKTATTPSGAYSGFTVKGIRILGTSRATQTGLYVLNFDGCTFEDLYFNDLQYGINTAALTGRFHTYNQLVTLRHVQFSNIKETCFAGGAFNDALLIENCLVGSDGTNTTNVAFSIDEANGVNIIGGIYDQVHTAFQVFRSNGVNVSGIYSEAVLYANGEPGRVFNFISTTGIKIEGSWFNLTGDGTRFAKVAKFTGSYTKGVVFTANRFAIHPNDASGGVLQMADAATRDALAGGIVFLGNSTMKLTGDFPWPEATLPADDAYRARP